MLEMIGNLHVWELHSKITGQVDRVAEDEEDCFCILREFLTYLPSNGDELPPVRDNLSTDIWTGAGLV